MVTIEGNVIKVEIDASHIVPAHHLWFFQTELLRIIQMLPNCGWSEKEIESATSAAAQLLESMMITEVQTEKAFAV